MTARSLLALLLPVVLATGSGISPAIADELDMTARARAGAAQGLPVRGLSMAQVESRHGAPLEKLPAAGGDTPRHPQINRWRYDGYIVYFERNRVIHSVLEGFPATAE